MDVVEAQGRDLKRRLKAQQEAQVEAQQRKQQCAEYHWVGFTIRQERARRAPGIRAELFDLAETHNAQKYRDSPVYHKKEQGEVLVMELYFLSTAEAGSFMSALKKRDWIWRRKRAQVTYPTTSNPVFLARAKMEKLYCTHYNTMDNLESPEYALPPDCLERVVLNDEDKLQMFEKSAYMRQVHAYACDISSTPSDTHAARVNNTLNMSWLGYLYFKGEAGVVPCMLVCPTAIHEEEMIEVGEREVKRQKMDVTMEFHTKDNMEEMKDLLQGYTEISDKCLKTSIYAQNAKTMAKNFHTHYIEVRKVWERADRHAPEFRKWPPRR
jgi:hypothetical protein